MGKKEWLREIYRRRDGEKDEQRETCRRPQRRIRLTNYLLLHYKGCQPGRLCQLSYTLTPVSEVHTYPYTTTYRHSLTHTHQPALTYDSYLLHRFLKNAHACTHTHTHQLYLLLTGDKGACHRSDAVRCCCNVIATLECVRQK